VDDVTRPEVRRPVSPMEQWFWIANQVSPLHVIARVRLVGHLPEGVVERAAAALTVSWALRLICPASVGKSSRIFRLMELNGPLNVGIWTISGCDIPARIGAWRLSGAQLVSGVLPFGYLVATVNTSQGELFWNFTYPEGAVSQRTATGFADGCLQNLLHAIA